MAHMLLCEEQVGFTITQAKTKYGLNCTLPAQSVHCVALLCPASACSMPDKTLHPPFNPPFLKGQNKAAVSVLECAAGSDLNLHHQRQ